jgi:hypothetical protein
MSDSGSDLASNISDPAVKRYKNIAKINQILQVCVTISVASKDHFTDLTFSQQFFGKSALIILGSRVILPQTFDRNGELRVNRWVSA